MWPKWPSIIFWQNMYESITVCEIIKDLSLF